ncbi:hypothetical protein AZI87_03930 [Bdellovibrio bacteriovorus]|uniref:TadE-like protein n=1 Tax=Bdellovibrio bacteriovorus TaxID=959 RepID=A0A162GL00_BDEBC|nr:hypothetical protein [Bdellovibrio bacteriovorus]KYG68409.1 hypothetical protein AZI87_03930 [Bdellovibrio bacteriovorus]
MRTGNRQGQGVVEALLSLPFLFLAGSAITALLYRGVVFYYIDYQLHEALICTQHESERFCKNELHQRLGKVLFLNSHYETEITRNRRTVKGKVLVNLSPELSIEKELKKSL